MADLDFTKGCFQVHVWFPPSRVRSTRLTRGVRVHASPGFFLVLASVVASGAFLEKYLVSEGQFHGKESE